MLARILIGQFLRKRNGWFIEMVHADVCNDMGSFISAAKFPSSFNRASSLFKFRQCENYSEQSKSYFEPLTIAWQRCVLQCEYFDVVCLYFHRVFVHCLAMFSL